MDVSYVVSELLPGPVVSQAIFSSVCFLEADQQRKAPLKYDNGLVNALTI